jgi:hypothetical protein
LAVNLWARWQAFLLAEDRAINSFGGGKLDQTVSGTVGRACERGLWWGPPCRFLIDVQPWFGRGHCERVAVRERGGE